MNLSCPRKRLAFWYCNHLAGAWQMYFREFVDVPNANTLSWLVPGELYWVVE